MGILIQKGGPLTTVQDTGRVGYQDMGFAESGAMDKRALKLANLLLGNGEKDAALEVTMMGPSFVFEEANCFVLTGADMGAKLNGAPLEMDRVYAARAGDKVEFPPARPRQGLRSYIGFAGGLDLPLLMGSRSTYLKGKMGGLEGRGLKAGDRIGFLAPKATLPNLEKRRAPQDFEAVYSGRQTTLRVVLGPQDDCFSQEGIWEFIAREYTVTPNSDRMGIRLEGPAIEHCAKADIISDGIACGAIQVPKDGKPIIMMADRQSTGGYTKIANVITADLPKAAQRMIGDRVRFEVVTVQQAQQLLRQEEAALKRLAEGWQ